MFNRREMEQWGPNLLAMSARMTGSRLQLKYRGWRPTLVLLVLIGLMLFGFSDGRLSSLMDVSSYPLMGMPALLTLILMAFLAISYIQEVVLDFASREIRTRSGFWWKLRRAGVPFDEVEHILVQGRLPMVTRSPSRPGLESTGTGWDVVIVAGPALAGGNLLGRIAERFHPGLSRQLGLVFPGLNVWRSANEEQALKVARALAERIGCSLRQASTN